MPNMPKAVVQYAQAAMKKIAYISLRKERRNSIKLVGTLSVAALLGACATNNNAAPDPLPLYRCEYGIEFTAKFTDDAVTLQSSSGYDVLYRGSRSVSDAKNPNEYSNVRMIAEFKMGASGREALLRYPSLPLVSRCVRGE